MSTCTKLGFCTGALLFFLNGRAADRKATRLKSCGTLLLCAEEHGGYWILVHDSYSGQLLQHKEAGYFARLKLNDLISPSGLKRNQSCFLAHKMWCNIWLFEKKEVSFQTRNAIQSVILSWMTIIVCWLVRGKCLWVLSMLLVYQQAGEQANLKYTNFCLHKQSYGQIRSVWSYGQYSKMSCSA